MKVRGGWGGINSAHVQWCFSPAVCDWWNGRGGFGGPGFLLLAEWGSEDWARSESEHMYIHKQQQQEQVNSNYNNVGFLIVHYN